MRIAVLASALVAGGVLAANATADGLPVVGVDVGATGVGSPAGDVRYVTLAAEGGTVVAAVEQDGGRVARFRFLAGRFTVPAVAYDGSAAGLSADGRTLVLIRPRLRFPRARTPLAVLGTARLRPRELVTLPGDFSFDALSPEGRWLYLVEYPSRRDPTRYLVRLYDLRRNRLLLQPIIDPREVGDVMRGSPVTRAASPDGRWAYTLYDGAGGHPFVHALDTVARTARCIDLHDLAGYPDLFELRLAVSADGATLTVLDGEHPLAVVDSTTFRVSEPAEKPEETAAREPVTARSQVAAGRRGDSFPWAFVAAPAAGVALGIGAAAAVRLRRRRLAPV